jgi:molybdate transport system substrate-binding protein
MAKLKVMCARSMHKAVQELAADFTRDTGNALDLAFGTVGALQARIDAGESADIVILSIPFIDRLEAAGMLVPDSRADVARTSIGLCVRDGAASPAIATPEAFRNTLVAARAIAFSDAAVGGSAGVHLARLFEELGLADMIRAKAMPQKSGGEVAARVAEGVAEIGMTLMAEIAPVKGARIVGPLPQPLGNDTTYCAAIFASSPAQAAARAFIAHLTHAATHRLWRDCGFALTAAPQDATVS